jgi:hypothetical protein
VSSAGHLARRFLGSLRPGGPRRSDALWVRGQLLPAELTLWAAMPAADRRHAAAVGRRVVAAGAGDRPVVAAALLHDVGKTVSHLSTMGRVAATVLAAWLGRERVAAWTEGRGYSRRVGLYLEHPKLGGDLLQLAGSDPLTIAWAREHHLPPEQWTVPAATGELLKAADDD